MKEVLIENKKTLTLTHAKSVRAILERVLHVLGLLKRIYLSKQRIYLSKQRIYMSKQCC